MRQLVVGAVAVCFGAFVLPAGAACPVVPAGDIQPGDDNPAPCRNEEFGVISNVAYGSNLTSQVLDIHVPNAGARPLPVVVWIHGGAWRSGRKEQIAQARSLICRGYALVSVEYRLSGEAFFPAQIHDVKAAIRFVRANAAAYGLDPHRIAVFGSSAGGHLAAFAGTGEGVAELTDAGIGDHPTVSSRVQAVVDWYGPTDFSQMDAQILAQGNCSPGQANHSKPMSGESLLLGCTVGDSNCASAVARANPITHVRAGNSPPFLIMHGDADCISPRAQSTLLSDALRDAHACVTERTVLGAGHGGPSWQKAQVQDAVAQFLDAALAPQALTPPVANCAAFVLTGNPRSPTGAAWTYQSTDNGVAYFMRGVVFVPGGAGPFPGVVVSHGKSASPESYTRPIARTMAGWGMVAIAPHYTHFTADTGLPAGGEGASEANVLRAHKARDLLTCLDGVGASVDMARVAAHGHSMGAYVTAQLVGSRPGDFRAASHTAGGVGANCTDPARCPIKTSRIVAGNIIAPYQIHHSRRDPVPVADDESLVSIFRANGTLHDLHTDEYEYPGAPTSEIHRLTAFDANMLQLVREWYRSHGVLP